MRHRTLFLVLTIGVGHLSGCAPWATNPENNNVVCIAPGAQTKPMLVSDGADGAIVVWVDERNARTAGKDIYAQRIDQDGKLVWPVDGVPVCIQPGDQSEVRIVGDGSGGAIIVWKDARSASTGMDVYAQRVNADGRTLWAANGTVVCNSPGDQVELSAISDVRNGAYIAWIDKLGKTIKVSRIDGNGNLASGWNADGNAAHVRNDNPYGGEHPILAGDGSGGVIVAWRNGPSSFNFFLQHFTPNGETRWGADGASFVEPHLTNNSDIHQLVGTRDGCIAVFDTEYDLCDSRGGLPYAPRLLTQRFSVGSSTIVRNWGPPSPSCYYVRTAGGFQPWAVVAPDGADGVVVFLRDADSYADGAPTRFVAQRLSNTGERMWTDVGQPLISNHEYVERLVVYRDAGIPHRNVDAVSDLANGGIVVWTDIRDSPGSLRTNTDLFAQRVNGVSGLRMWGENGVAVSTARGNQLFPDAISGDRGGIIVVWQDERRGEGKADIYAQRINAEGRYGR